MLTVFVTVIANKEDSIFAILADQQQSTKLFECFGKDIYHLVSMEWVNHEVIQMLIKTINSQDL